MKMAFKMAFKKNTFLYICSIHIINDIPTLQKEHLFVYYF
ncbi:hypothetical protein EfmE980_0357 [Enterococcus faecium E980]|nr:hypothetical protein EfmE980_0357 [Enterococcus faecium E980]